MTQDFSVTTTGWFLIVGAAMQWLGWILLPSRIGIFFKPTDFASVKKCFHFWIWMYRFHIFGMIIVLMGIVAFSAILGLALVWAGAAVITGGIFVGALGTAFYYHHGAWGALETDGYNDDQLDRHVEALKLDTEYVTCLVRFARVFFGLGQLVLSFALVKWGVFPPVVGYSGMLLGLAAMALTMGFPDNLEYYQPVFHLNMAWLLLIGVLILTIFPT